MSDEPLIMTVDEWSGVANGHANGLREPVNRGYALIKRRININSVLQKSASEMVWSLDVMQDISRHMDVLTLDWSTSAI